MSKEPLEHPRTLRTGSRLADEIKKVSRKWTGSIESGCCMIECGLDSFYLLFLSNLEDFFLILFVAFWAL